jgi:formamidase
MLWTISKKLDLLNYKIPSTAQNSPLILKSNFPRCEVLRGGCEQYLTPMGPTKLHVNPIFEIGPLEPRFSEWLVFEGISVDEKGRQHYLDATVAYKRAVLNAIDYLSKFGYTKEQVTIFPSTLVLAV